MKKLAILVIAMAVGLMLVPKPMFAADGAGTFAAKCAACHGADGAGKMKGTPNMTTAEFQKKSDADLANYIKTGNGKAMHAFEKKGVDEATTKALVEYIRTLKK